MNSRLQELMIQAMTETGRLMDVQATYQRFAELIVKECTDFLRDDLDDHFAAEQLEEHFGVK